MVLMNGPTATKRGLRVLNLHSDKAASEEHYKDPTAQALPSSFIYQRRRLVRHEERQKADLSISHDGNYAFAVCLALSDGTGSDERDLEPLIDSGEGEPIHEPEWGDVGFESQEVAAEDGEEMRSKEGG